MNSPKQDQGKHSDSEQLSQEIRDHIEREVEEEVDEELSKHSRYNLVLSSFRTWFIAVAATIMALGQFSEAVTLIEDGIDSLRSRFTNTVEYERIANIHINNTESYIEDLLGVPQISKSITDTIDANYFYDDKFLLTIFIEDSRVAAYTVIPLQDDFNPEIIDSAEQNWELQKATYANFPANPKLYMVDHSATASYYLESLDTGRIGLFVQNYLGNVSLTGTAVSPLLIELYNDEVTGSPEDLLEAQERLRANLPPNLFGMGTLELSLIQQSLLTGAEFTSYFGG